MGTLAAALLFLLFFGCGSAMSDTEQDADTEMEEDPITEIDLNKNMDKFKNADAVIEFKKHWEKGLLGRDVQFNMRDPNIKAQTISLVDLFFYAEDEEVIEQILALLYPTMNREQVAYALTVASLRRKDLGWKEGETLRAWFHVMPNYFVPQSVLNKIKASVEQGTYNKSNAPLIVPDESDPTAYFREDPDLSRMYYNWNLLFPNWMDPKKYGDPDWPTRGDLFYEFHNQLAVAYFLRSDMKKLKLEWMSQWKDAIQEGYKTQLANWVHRPFSSRAPKHPRDENEQYKKLMEVVEKIKVMYKKETIYVNESYSIPFQNPEGTTIATMLSNLVYQTVYSVNPSYYGSLFEACINYLSSVGSDPSKDIGGLSGNPLTALRDPAFYKLLWYVSRVVEDYKTLYTDPYTKKEILDDDLTMNSIEASRMETFFEPIVIDVSSTFGRGTPQGSYIVKQLRLNHRPVTLSFNISSKAEASRKTIITVYLLKDIFTASQSEQFQPIDSFKANVMPGENIIARNLSDSYIFADAPDVGFMVPCGIPKTLMLPKGTEEGLKMTLLAVITPDISKRDEDNEPTDPVRSPLCGNYLANHGRSFGFPLDRHMPPPMTKQQTAYFNATIYHTRNTFQGGVTI